VQEKNIVANTYWADNERFADIINVGMFQAKKVLSAEQLSERDGYLGHAEKKKKQDSIQRYRDVTKKADFGTNFMIIGIENQSELHLAMPVRVMGYEFMNYNKQLKEIKASHDKKKDLSGIELLSGISREEKLQAVCTLVIYYGKEPWTGPTRLSEMMDFGDLPEEVRNVVADYPIHVLDVRRFEDSEKLESEARLFFGILQRDEDTDKCEEYCEENKEAFQNLSDDTYEAIVAFTNSEKLLEDKKVNMNEEGGVDMCKAFEGMILKGEKRGEARGEVRGEARGEARGEQKMMRLIQCMTEDGALDSIPRIASEPSFYQEMLKKYNIGNELAVS